MYNRYVSGRLGRSLLPIADDIVNLGHSTARFGSLYLTGNTIDLGGTAISSTADGVSFTNSANSQAAVPLTVSSIQLNSAGNVVTLQASSIGLQVADILGNTTAVAGSGTTVIVSNTAPATTTEGSLWLDEDTGDLSIYFGNAWAGVTEYAGGGGGGGGFAGGTNYSGGAGGSGVVIIRYSTQL